MEQLPDNAAHILVVDDDQRIRDLLARYLFEQGFRVSTATDAASALLGDKQQPLTPVALAAALGDPAFIDELLQDARQALLGDLENVEQISNAQARVAIDEMQHAVMGPPEAVGGEDGIGLTREVAIGKEHELDEGDQMRIGGRRGFGRGLKRRCLCCRRAPPADELRIYVSHVDLFGLDC